MLKQPNVPALISLVKDVSKNVVKSLCVCVCVCVCVSQKHDN